MRSGPSEHAGTLVQKYPNQPEPTIWPGILISEQASMANENRSPVKALRLALKARDILTEAEKVDPVALDAGAPTSLGVLYYRVPGFPLGFGDKTKARHLLQEATTNAPNGLDASYFYGDRDGVAGAELGGRGSSPTATCLATARTPPAAGRGARRSASRQGGRQPGQGDLEPRG